MGRIYLYGIIEATRGGTLDILGVDGTAPVHTMALDGLGCVASDYNGEGFGDVPRETLIRSLFAHQMVVEHVMQEGQAVLPAKFGTLLDSVDEALALLAQGHSRFVKALAAIQDRVEVEVAATWRRDRVLQEVATADVVVRAREAMTLNGRPTLEDRVRLGQLVKTLLDQRRDSHRKRMLTLLGPLAVDSTSNALVSDEMVMNEAFLVEQSRQGDFDAAMERLDELFQGEIAFRVIGPLPPYSFSSVEVTRVTPGQVEEAWRTLGLAGAASQAEVRKAYRRLAAREHRGSMLDGGGTGERLAYLRKASELLEGYCRAQGEAERGEGQYGQGSGAAAPPFLIAIKRTARDEVDPARFGATLVVAERGR